jgi:nucleotide-binding universal stress UspA family protein
MKSILLHVYDDTGLEGRMQAAFDLARAFEGHVTCLHATPFEDYLENDPLTATRLPVEFSKKMKQLRDSLRDRVEERFRVEGVNWDWVHVDDLPSSSLARFSIISDVVIVSHAGTAFLREEPRPLAAAVATEGRAPVLAVFESLSRLDVTRPILIAWNGSPEAAAAMRASVPLLALASNVQLLEVDERIPAYPRDLAARYLARHGIEVEIVQRRPLDGGVAETIERAAYELGAGMIVMGAFGHSRLREFLLGGVTRSMLGECGLPLFLAH